MSFADFVGTERSRLMDSQFAHYNGIGADQVDRAETRPENTRVLSFIEALPESGKLPSEGPSSIRKAAPIDISSPPVQREANKVNWWIAVPLLLLGLFPGLIYLSCVACSNRGIDPVVSQQDGEVGRSIPTPQARRGARPPKRNAGPTFAPYEGSVNLHHVFSLSGGEARRFENNKGGLEGEAQSLVRLKGDLQKEQLELEEQIPLVKEMGFIERKRKGFPPSSELQAKLDKVNEEIAEINKRAREVSDELRSDCLQHPEFKKMSRSHKGFPFRIYFGPSELQQGIVYERMDLMPRNNLQFQIKMNKKLMSWSGEGDIDPIRMNLPAKAQGVLHELALAGRRHEPLTANASDRRLNPTIVDKTQKVTFTRDASGPIIRVEQVVQTSDGKKYNWTETVRFDTGEPRVSRQVTEIKE